MTTYSIAVSGKGIKIVPSAGPSLRFSKPVIVTAPKSDNLSLRCPDLSSAARTDLIEISQGQTLINFTYDELTTVGGVAKAGTLAGVADQITALLPTSSGGGSAGITEVGAIGALPASVATPTLYYVTGGDMYLLVGTAKNIVYLEPQP